MNVPDRVPGLLTERLSLRGVIDADAAPFFAIFSDAEVMRYWSGPPMREEGEARALVMRAQRQAAERTALRWSIVRVSDAAVVGTCTLFAFDPQNLHAEVGYALGREHWGQGYMHEALVALVDWAFAELRLHRIEADADPRNAASVRALERLGFVREGLLRERWHVAGEISDSLLFGLLRRDWRGSTPDAKG